MGSYSLVINLSAARELAVLPLKTRRRLVPKIEALATTCRPPGVEMLSGRGTYRIRPGAYRVIFSIDEADRTVTVAQICKRRGA